MTAITGPVRHYLVEKGNDPANTAHAVTLHRAADELPALVAQ